MPEQPRRSRRLKSTSVSSPLMWMQNLIIQEHVLTLPLVWGESSDPRTIDVFARVVARTGGEELPFLVFLQGGPGMESPRPFAAPPSPAWLQTALTRYRVVFLDQRGTGLSTPVGDGLLQLGDDAAAEYLTYLRADSIVQDCEAFRKYFGVEQWSVLGQSFGGFTTLHYLTVASDSLDRVFITGGLSAVERNPDDVYALCYDKMRDASEQYYRRFPDHRDRMLRIAMAARNGEITLPSGEVLSVSRLRSLGHLLGGDDGWQTLWSILERDPGSHAFAYDVAKALAFDGRNPLYYVLHESSYADGFATRWSAERTQPDDFASDVSLLTGEHVAREWADTVPAFRPWKGVTEILAEHTWPKLYSAQKIAESGARGAAAVYFADRFVPLEFSIQTAELLPDVRLLVTSEYEHSGLRVGPVLEKLFGLAFDSVVR